jgi:putative thioredoxin
MPDVPYIFEATEDNFASLVLDNSAKGPVLVNYWAPWAGPCHKLWPVLEKLAADYGGKFLLVNVNTDKQRQLAREHGVRSLPTLKLFRHRKVMEDIHGAQPEADLRRLIDKHIARQSDAMLAAAVKTYQQGDIEGAVRLLRQAEEADPDNLRIPLTLAKLLMQHGRVAEAEELLRLLPAEAQQDPEVTILAAHLSFIRVAQGSPPIETLEQTVAADPADCEARYRLSAVKLLQDDYEGALEQLLEIMRRDRSFRNDAGRKGMLAVLQILDEDSDLAKRYRSLMFKAIH